MPRRAGLDLGGVALDLRQLRPRHGGEDRAEPVVVAERAEVEVALAQRADDLAEHLQRVGPVAQLRVVGGEQAAFAGGRQVLAGHDREGGDVAERADPAVLVRGAVRLGGVLDDGQPVARREGEDRVHVGRQAVEVHGHDRPRPVGAERFELRGVDRERPRVDVGEHRDPVLVHDRGGRCEERERGDDDLVARFHADGRDRGVQCGSAAVDRDRVGAADVGAELLLEQADLLVGHPAEAPRSHRRRHRVDVVVVDHRPGRLVDRLAGQRLAAEHRERADWPTMR